MFICFVQAFVSKLSQLQNKKVNYSDFLEHMKVKTTLA